MRATHRRGATSGGLRALPITAVCAWAALAAMAGLVAGCATGTRGGTGVEGRPPGVGEQPDDVSAGPPEIRVVYPDSGAAVTAGDSTFVFGSVRPADARVTVNGFPARQAEGGGWIAWVPLRPGAFTFQVVAWPAVPANAAGAGDDPAMGDSAPLAALEWPVQVPGGLEAAWAGVLDTASVTPADTLELEPGDPVRLRFRGVRGLRAEAVLGDGLARASFVEEGAGAADDARRTHGPADAGGTPESRGEPEPDAAPRVDVTGLAPAWTWYSTDLVLPDAQPAAPRAQAGRRGRAAPDSAGGPAGSWTWGATAVVAVEFAADSSLRYQLPAPIRLRNPHAIDVAVLDDDPDGTGTTDGTVVGLAAPDGVYFLFLPNGTRARTGRRVGGFRELVLDEQLSVWAPVAEVHPLPVGTPEPRSRVPVVRTRRVEDRTRVVIPLETPLPFQVRQETDPARYEVTLFGARAAAEFVRHDAGDPLVRALRWNQPASERFVLEIEVAGRQPWGWRAGYEGDDFVLEVRRPPEVRDGSVEGLRIIVDAGHAPDPGAVGPTGLAERDANLGVAIELARLLEEEGAEVVLTRDADTPTDLAPTLLARAALPLSADADLLVSVHHNALPDGVNPFESHGTSVFYYHPQSLPLARAIQRELVRELGLRDLGIGHANLAVVRPTWAPAVLTEAAFMMIPEQEGLLRTDDFRRSEARAILRGIERFLRERSRR